MDTTTPATVMQRESTGERPTTESSVSAVSWAAIFGGAVASVAITLTLSALGVGIGLAAMSPWPYHGMSPSAFTISTAIWLIVVQWLASGVGGYLTGRLRTKWVGTHTHEVFFRDTAHGFITWALGTLVAAIVVGSAASSATISATETAAGGSGVAQLGGGTVGSVAIYTALSMIIGAFVASVAAALGGHRRDEHP